MGGEIGTADISTLCHHTALTLAQPVLHPQHPAAAVPLWHLCVFHKCHCWAGENPAASRDPGIVAPHCEKGWIFKDENQITTPLTSQKLLL